MPWPPRFCSWARRRAGGRHTAPRHAGRTTFAYGIYAYDFASLKAFAGFRQETDGRLTPFRLWVNSGNVPDLPAALTPSPDRRFLYVENSSDREYPGAHIYFIRYHVLPTGQLREADRFDLGHSTNLVFQPSGRYAYTLSEHEVYAFPGVRQGQGRVLQFRIGPAGRPLWPPIATAPSGLERYGMAVSARGHNLYALDAQGGRLWQYALTAQGRPVPMNPPSLPVGRMRVGPIVTPGGGVYTADDRAVYGFRTGPGGALTPLPPFRLAAGDMPTSIAPLGGGALAVQLPTRLLVLRAGPSGALTRAASLPLPYGSLCGVDPSGRFLYVQGLHTRIYIFRIGPGGRLKILHAPVVRTGTDITDLVFVRR